MTSSSISVPMGNLHAQYLEIKSDIDDAIARVIATSGFVRGPEVDAFEGAFAKAIGVEHCVSCANGTEAIYIAMVALGVKPGDEVIVPAMSWISTSETVSQAGARVVFCDIDPKTYTLDPEKLAACITDKTVGIIPVHLYGHPADLEPILQIADDNGLWIIEDTAQGHLATYRGKTVGGFGAAATYSFYPGKNLGAMGDAGAVVTRDAALAAHMTKFARHGGLKKGDHEIEGINSRLDSMQAAVLSAKLPHLRAWTNRRRAIAEEYCSRLSDVSGLELPSQAEWGEHVWHLFVVRTEKRDALAQRLKSAGIQTSVNYPRALPFLPCYSAWNHEFEDFPVAHKLSQQGLSLPLYPEMSQDQIDHVVETLKKIVPEL